MAPQRKEWTLQRIFENSSPEPNTGCWLWLGSVNNNGYALGCRDNKTVLVHRLALELKVGASLGRGVHACHRCDVRSCVNPAHLFPGTALANERDKIAKGRRFVAHGERKGSVLTEASVLEIRKLRAAGVKGPAIARKFGIGISTVSEVARGFRWKHVAGGDS